MLSVTFENITKSFGATAAVRGISIEMMEGELFFLLGPSGCGKTTCLRMAAGFEKPDSGRILFGGRDVTEMPPHRRNVGMVFQSYALFPHLSIEKNVGFGLRFRNMPPADKRARIADAMEHTRISEYGSRLPSQLSGGQQQRVALARALVIRPDVLLLDEPLSNLDAALRAEMRGEIRRIQRSLGITTMYVTHDQEDALSMADRVALVRDGSLVQVGAPQDIYLRPKNSFAATFVGKTNLMEGKVAAVSEGIITVDTPAGRITASAGKTSAGQGEKIALSIRPENISVRQGAAASGSQSIPAVIENVTFLGGASRIDAVTAEGGVGITAMISGGAPPAAGISVFLTFDAKDVVALEE